MKAIILAGGSGSRLWPLSRELYPKQLLKLEDKYSLLQSTFLKLNKLIKANDILSITNIKNFSDVKMQLGELDKNSVILAEPLSKNTAPAIACSLEYFKQTEKADDIVLIMPSDHLIKNTDNFIKTIQKAKTLANLGYIVTFGITPTYPETGYGYIKTTNQLENGYKVERFVEKPNLEAAEKYLQEKKYYWNSGIFMGKISTFLEEFSQFAPEIVNQSKKLNINENQKINYSIYENMPATSIDYAIMEKSNKIALVELESDWNDLGSWQSLYEIKEKDSNGNVLTGNVVVDNVKNSFIYSSKELVAASELENILIVETEDAIMACDLRKTQNVKNLFEKLKKHESETIQLHKTVFRPWGYYTCLNAGEGYLTKMICVQPNQKLSIQSHNHRSEHWVVLEGTATIILEDETIICHAGDSVDIPLKAKHSLQNHQNTELKIIEVQKGDYISEDDIIRYNDIYGRV